MVEYQGSRIYANVRQRIKAYGWYCSYRNCLGSGDTDTSCGSVCHPMISCRIICRIKMGGIQTINSIGSTWRISSRKLKCWIVFTNLGKRIESGRYFRCYFYLPCSCKISDQVSSCSRGSGIENCNRRIRLYLSDTRTSKGFCIGAGTVNSVWLIADTIYTIQAIYMYSLRIYCSG